MQFSRVPTAEWSAQGSSRGSEDEGGTGWCDGLNCVPQSSYAESLGSEPPNVTVFKDRVFKVQ